MPTPRLLPPPPSHPALRSAQRSAPWASAALVALMVPLVLSGCGGGSGGDSTPLTSAQASAVTAPAFTTATAEASPTVTAAAVRPPRPPVSALASVGNRLFDEKSLSASGRLACVSCHVEARAHADPAGTFLPLGGIDNQRQGLRSSPSLRYLDTADPFRIDPQGRAHGGLFWDGRAATRAQQARGPLFNANEMANTDASALATRLRALPYAAELRAAAGLPASASDDQLITAAVTALERYQVEDPKFHPFTSKFDAVQDGRATFTAQELRGQAAFNDPQRGNCAACHDSRPVPNASGINRALFTNFSYHALGVPRNTSQATANPAFFDLGLCGPQRLDLTGHPEFCGQFRVPTLRNVALTGPYFHNARFATLEDVVAFYASRDLDPARWYPVVNGQVQLYNDLPVAYRANVHRGAPFRRPGQPPAFTPQDGADIVAFLRTLTDGFTPAPATP